MSTLYNILSEVKRLADNQSTLAELKKMLAQNIAKEQLIMSQITDWAAAEQVSLTAISTTLDSIVAGITALDALITGFQNSPGTLSPEDQAALDGIVAASAALVTKVDAISTAPPVAPGAPVASPSVKKV